MAPFRNRDRSNRSGRAQIEHNVLEGLPINQYREVEVTVGANAGDNKPADKDAWPELPMPRDSHMLPEHSQQLLRAARSGRVYKPPAPPEDDNEMKDDEEEHKEVQVGFTVKKYVKVARHLETSEPEYLAKRRKGLPSQYAVNGAVQPPLRETKVKKLDAEGNATVYKVLVPEGQAVDGEVNPADAAIEAAPAAAVPGTVVEGVGIVNAEGVVVARDIAQQTPPRRRPPPPKKKGGPGRGKRRVAFAKGAAEQGTPTSNPGGDLLAAPSIKQEGGSVEPSDGDTPMADAGAHDDEGSGEEGSDDEDHEGEHTSNQATPAPATPLRLSEAPTSIPNPDPMDIAEPEVVTTAAPATITPEDISQPSVEPESIVPSMSMPGTIEQSVGRDPSSSPDLPLSAISHSRQNSLNKIPTVLTTDEPQPASQPQTQPNPGPEPEPEAEPMVIESTEADTISNAEPEAAPITTIATEPEVTQESPAAPAALVSPLSPPLAPVTADASVPAPVPAPAPISAPEPVSIPALNTAENVSAPPSEPDLMASLDKHLEQDSENISGP